MITRSFSRCDIEQGITWRILVKKIVFIKLNIQTGDSPSSPISAATVLNASITL